MTPFWGSFFEHLRGCGRRAPLFMVAMAGLLVLIVVGSSLEHAFPGYRIHALSGAALITMIWVAALCLRARSRRRERLERQPLSENEWRIARRRLRRSQR